MQYEIFTKLFSYWAGPRCKKLKITYGWKSSRHFLNQSAGLEINFFPGAIVPLGP